MAYRVELTARAVGDLEMIYAHIAAATSRQALLWFRKLTATLESLETFPDRGAPAPEHPALRQLLYGTARARYRLIYLVDAEHQLVTVLHIRHGARAEAGDLV